MGDFAKSVQNNKLPGPNSPAFELIKWKSRIGDQSLDDEDIRILNAGFLFGEIFEFLRGCKKVSDFDLKSSAFIRILVGFGTYNLLHLKNNMDMDRLGETNPPTLIIHSVLAKTVAAGNGQHYSPSELLSGYGDGMRLIIRDLLNSSDSTKFRTEFDISIEELSLVSSELNLAITYYCMEEEWVNCLRNKYMVIPHKLGIALTPSDVDLEISRVASIFRRQNIEMQNSMDIALWWNCKCSVLAKEKLCEIPLVYKITGDERIISVELGMNSDVFDFAGVVIEKRLLLENGCYQFLLNMPLPKLGNFSLQEIIRGWRLLHSLSFVIFSNLGNSPKFENSSFLRYAPRIDKDLLCDVFIRSMSLSKSTAYNLIQVFVFNNIKSGDLWSQPLIEVDNDFLLVIPCIYSVQLQRIVEIWMRQGGLDLSMRGEEFERYCRKELIDALKVSPIREHVIILENSLNFKPQGDRTEEVDIVIIIGGTVLLIEAKCILWPENSIQFANYYSTIEYAVAQISRKRDFVREHKKAFVAHLHRNGFSIPDELTVICCVLSNSAVYCGFPLKGVPIVDLSMIIHFLQNKYIKAQITHGTNIIHEAVLNFYQSFSEAAIVLNDYLLDPPQLSDVKRFVKKRELISVIQSPNYGKLIHQTFKVEIDTEEVSRKYNVPSL